MTSNVRSVRLHGRYLTRSWMSPYCGRAIRPSTITYRNNPLWGLYRSNLCTPSPYRRISVLVVQQADDGVLQRAGLFPTMCVALPFFTNSKFFPTGQHNAPNPTAQITIWRPPLCLGCEGWDGVPGPVPSHTVTSHTGELAAIRS